MNYLVLLNKAYDNILLGLAGVTKQEITWSVLITAVVQFATRSWQINILLVFALFIIIGVNTWSGVRLAKQKKVYDFNILKEKAISKLIGYFILILAASLLSIVFFLVSLKDGELLFPEFFLNLIVTLTVALLAIFETKSALTNLEKSKIHVPEFLKNAVDKAEDKINDVIK